MKASPELQQAILREFKNYIKDETGHPNKFDEMHPTFAENRARIVQGITLKTKEVQDTIEACTSSLSIDATDHIILCLRNHS